MNTHKTSRSGEIREFILDHISLHSVDISHLTQDAFQISRQAVHYHLKRLIDEGLIEASGQTRSRRYLLKVISHEVFTLSGLENLKDRESFVWMDRMASHLRPLPGNIYDICQYGFTEMMNNAIDHSAGSRVWIEHSLTARHVYFRIVDDGIGIFRKIAAECGLENERHALLELAKGKLSTDPDNHSGEGIYFTSRMFDNFSILSRSLYFGKKPEREGWLLEGEKDFVGTAVFCETAVNSALQVKDVFDAATVDHDIPRFSKTHVPVSLARLGDDKLVSRSQAKRVLARFTDFEEVMLDFSDVDSIGQAFADEIFRVFTRNHPEVRIVVVAANEQVSRMIAWVENRDDLP